MNGSPVLIFTPSSGIVGKAVVLCPWVARTEPPSYLWGFHTSVYALHHYARYLWPQKASPRPFVAAPHRDVYIGLFFLCPHVILMITFLCCPGGGLPGSRLFFGHPLSDRPGVMSDPILSILIPGVRLHWSHLSRGHSCRALVTPVL